MATFAEVITKLRGDKKRQAVADEMGISRASLEYYEKGKRKPDIEVLAKFADYYDVSADYLLGRTAVKTTDYNLQFVCDYLGLTEEAAENIKKMKFISDNSELKVLSSVLNQALKNDFILELCFEATTYSFNKMQLFDLNPEQIADLTKRECEKQRIKDIIHKCEAALYRVQKRSIDFCDKCADIIASNKDGDTNGNDQKA